MKRSFLLMIVICGIMLTGCAQLTNLNDKQSDEVAEYMAGTVLRYTKNYEEALIYPDDMKELTGLGSNSETLNLSVESDGTTTENSVSLVPAVTDKQEDILSVKEIFELISDSKYAVTYTGHASYTSYPNDNDYFTLEPTMGNKLLTFTFTFKNTQKKDISIDYVDKNIDYTLESLSGSSYKPSVTLLTNDIQYLKSTIKANQSLKAVLVFEVAKDTKEKDLSLVIDYSGISSVINIDK